MTTTHLQTGHRGEKVAERYLTARGYRVMGRNIRVGRYDEIDLLMLDPIDHVLVFCEVKTRLRDDPDYRPDLNLTYRKRKNMRRAARAWVARHRWEAGYRLDLIAVAAGKVVDHVIEVRWE